MLTLQKHIEELKLHGQNNLVEWGNRADREELVTLKQLWHGRREEAAWWSNEMRILGHEMETLALALRHIARLCEQLQTNIDPRYGPLAADIYTTLKQLVDEE